MNKEEIIALVKDKVSDISDLDERLYHALELLEEYKDHKDFDEIISEVYFSIKKEIQENEDPRLIEFSEVLESTDDLIMNEKYEEVITLLTPYQDLVDEMLDVSNLEFDKLEPCCFFNETEKNLFYFMVSDPNKDTYLLNPLASEYYHRLCLVYLKTLSYDKAIKCCKEMLRFNPCSNQALLNMAYIAYSQGNYLTSLEYIKEFSNYAFDNTMIFEAYQILVDIYLGYEKYDYAAVFAYIGSSFTDNEEYEETMYNIYEKYKDEIRFDVDDESALDNFLSKEEFSYFPKDDVLDVLYTILMDLEEHNLMEDYFEVANMILSLVDDVDLENELKKKVSEMN